MVRRVGLRIACTLLHSRRMGSRSDGHLADIHKEIIRDLKETDTKFKRLYLHTYYPMTSSLSSATLLVPPTNHCLWFND